MENVIGSFLDTPISYHIKLELKDYFARSIFTDGMGENKSTTTNIYYGQGSRRRMSRTSLKKKLKVIKYILEFKDQSVFTDNDYYKKLATMSINIGTIIRQASGRDRLFNLNKINKTIRNQSKKDYPTGLDNPNDMIIFDSFISVNRSQDTENKEKASLVYKDFERILNTPKTFIVQNTDGGNIELKNTPLYLVSSISHLSESLNKAKIDLAHKKDLLTLFEGSITSNKNSIAIHENTLWRIDNLPDNSPLNPATHERVAKMRVGKVTKIAELERHNADIESKLPLVREEVEQLLRSIAIMTETIRGNRKALRVTARELSAGLSKYLGVEIKNTLKNLISPENSDW
jgi:hypothetical protein